MARTKRGPGRPRNPTRSVVIPLTLPKPTADVLATIARVAGVARATWARTAIEAAITRHGRRVARL